MSRPVTADTGEQGAAPGFDRFLLVRSDGTVVWETPEGWAAGAHLSSFIHPSGGRILDEAITSVVGGRAARREFECETVGADRQWKHCVLEVSAAPREYTEIAFVTIRELDQQRSEGRTATTDSGTVAGRYGAVDAAPRPGVHWAEPNPTPVDPDVPALAGSGGGSTGVALDALTSLANRDAVIARLREAADSGAGQLAVFYIDVDHFKRINDRLGHAGGDAVLLTVADRLRTAVRPGDLVSRFGGDEFVVVANSVDDAGVAAVIAERIRAGLDAPVRANGRSISVTLSVGAAVGEGREGRGLIEKADTALYRAKERGRDRVEIFRAGDRIIGSREARTDAVLAEALDNGRLDVFYEPIIQLASGAPVMMRVSLGALGGDEEGAEEPESLLRLAEESGLVVSLGAGVLDRACDAASTWPADEDGRPRVGLVWPMSSRQLEEPRAAEQVISTLKSHGAPLSWLMVEVSEDSLSQPGPAVLRTLDQLHAGGVRIMLSGFGGGSGGIPALRRFAIDALLMDRSLIDGITEDRRALRLVTATLGFGRLMELEVVVPGVDTEAEATLLRALGCNWASGPHFGPPEAAARMGPRSISHP